jgi:4-methyl-5(b-hydroxyethyl)-thiazole monophosphate biosynthesis
MKKVAVFFATGYEEVEALTVVDLLRREEIETLMVSVTEELLVESARGIFIQMDKKLTEIDFDTIDMIVLPGGAAGTEGLEACEPLMAQLDNFHAQKKPIAAICAAPSILGHRGILSGVMACSYPSFENHLTGATVLAEPAVWDGHIITSRGMGCSIDFALAIVAYFKGFKVADDLAEKIIY